MFLKKLSRKIRSFIKPSSTDSEYEKIIFEGKSKFRKLSIIDDSHKNTRTMYTGKKLFVAGVDKDTGFPINSPYFLADLVNPKPKKILFLGGGPNAHSSYVWRKYKPKEIDVVEHDKLNTKLAKKYFSLPDDKNFKIHHQNAVKYVYSCEKKYDVIFFNLGLTRKRASDKKDLEPLVNDLGIKRLNQALNNEGVIVFVTISKLAGKDLEFLRKLLGRFEVYFSGIFVFADNVKKKEKLQSVVFLITKKDINLEKYYKEFLNSSLRMHKKEVYELLFDKKIKNLAKLYGKLKYY